MRKTIRAIGLVSVCAASLAACGGGSSPPPTYSVTGTVSGLSGAGLVLQNNGANDLSLTTNGTFTISTAAAPGSTYGVTVKTQPTNLSQTCVVSNATGAVANANVSNIAVTCTTNSYSVIASVSGLAGVGLVLQNNGGADITVGGNGAVAINAALASGSAYNVTIKAQPVSPSQTCSVTKGSGTVTSANISDIAIICSTNSYPIGVSVSGLSGSGLVLQNNGGSDLTIAANGAYTFASQVLSGAPYSVTVKSQPVSPSQICSVTAGSGIVVNAAVSSVSIVCSNTYSVGGTVSGLLGSGLVLQNNGLDRVSISGNGSFTFPDRVAANGAYAVTVLTQPASPAQLCSVSGASGTVTSSNVANVAVSCSSTLSGSLTVDCVGANCGASNSTTYAGSGIGVWRYNNTSSALSATLNISISGVSAGKKALLLFTNGGGNATATAPSFGSSATMTQVQSTTHLSASNQSPELVAQSEEDAAHNHVFQLKREIKAELARTAALTKQGVPSMVRPAAAPAPLPTTNVGQARVWADNFQSYTNPDNYNTTARKTCAVSTGRTVVFWVDDVAWTSGKFTQSLVDQFAAAFCGSSGGYERLVALIGDIWGPHSYAQFMSDSSSLQDVNIVLVPTTFGYGGYACVYCGLLGSWYRKNDPTSKYVNQPGALAFFINISKFSGASTSASTVNYYSSSLIHESQHMINFYQRYIKRDQDHEDWLEETSAMMAEDIVSAAVISNTDGTPYGAMKTIRIPGYLATGGGRSYINWVTLDSISYDIGGSFGAFINRRFGITVFKSLVTNCNDGTLGVSSYQCLDSLLRSNGSSGLADDFARMGASLFGLMPATGVPAQYGFPSKVDSGYTLGAVDASAFSSQRPASTSGAGSTLDATTHTYTTETVSAGKSSYTRNGVIVPAGSSVTLVLQ